MPSPFFTESCLPERGCFDPVDAQKKRHNRRIECLMALLFLKDGVELDRGCSRN